MAFSFGSAALVDAAALSKFIFGVDDASTDVTLALTSQQIFSIELLVDAISGQICRYVDSNIKSAQYVEVWDGADSDEVCPTERPIISVEAFKIAASGQFSSGMDWVAQSPGTVFTDGKTIKLRDGAKTPTGRGVIQLTYTAGYATVPKDIQLATLLQFQWANKQVGNGTMVGLEAFSKGNESQKTDKSLKAYGLRSEVIGLIEPYRRFEAPGSVMFARVS